MVTSMSIMPAWEVRERNSPRVYFPLREPADVFMVVEFVVRREVSEEIEPACVDMSIAPIFESRELEIWIPE